MQCDTVNKEGDKDGKLEWKCMWCKRVFHGHNKTKIAFHFAKQVKTILWQKERRWQKREVEAELATMKKHQFMARAKLFGLRTETMHSGNISNFNSVFMKFPAGSFSTDKL